MLKGNVFPREQSNYLTQQRYERTTMSKATFMSSDREEETITIDEDDQDSGSELSQFYNVEDINKSILNQEKFGRRLNNAKATVTRRGFSARTRNKLSHRQLEIEEELHREIQNMLHNAEQQYEKESETFLKMTSKFKSGMAVDASSHPHNKNLKKDKTPLNDNSENEEDEEDEQSYRWGDEEDEEASQIHKENVAKNF